MVVTSKSVMEKTFISLLLLIVKDLTVLGSVIFLFALEGFSHTNYGRGWFVLFFLSCFGASLHKEG